MTRLHESTLNLPFIKQDCAMSHVYDSAEPLRHITVEQPLADFNQSFSSLPELHKEGV
jgi:hypothetical protein